MSKFVTNVAPEKQDAALEKMVAIIVEELRPHIGAMIDERLKGTGSGAGGEGMAANALAAKYTLPGGDDDFTPARASSNGRKMPDQWSGYDLNAAYQLPD